MLVYRGFAKTAPSSTVLTIGNFDGVHLGHAALLARVREVAATSGSLASLLSFEPHPREFFKRALVPTETSPVRLIPLKEKLLRLKQADIEFVCLARFNAAFAALSAQAFVDSVLVKTLRVKHLILGEDFRFGHNREGNIEFLREAGARQGFSLESINAVIIDGERVSSSLVRQTLADGNLEKAAKLLGCPYYMRGHVVHGYHRGREFGFATANIPVKQRTLPLQGVFAVDVSVDGKGAPLHGIANLGFRPSIATESRPPLLPLLEVHLFDFSGDLYGAQLTVRFLHKVRDEIHFPNFDALKAQIARDVVAAKNYFTQ